MYAFPRILSNLSFKNQGQSRAQALMMTSLRVAIIALLQRWVPAAEVFFLDYTEGWFPVQPLLGTPCRLLQLPQNHFQLVEKSSLVMSIFFFWAWGQAGRLNWFTVFAERCERGVKLRVSRGDVPCFSKWKLSSVPARLTFIPKLLCGKERKKIQSRDMSEAYNC